MIKKNIITIKNLSKVTNKNFKCLDKYIMRWIKQIIKILMSILIIAFIFFENFRMYETYTKSSKYKFDFFDDIIGWICYNSIQIKNYIGALLNLIILYSNNQKDEKDVKFNKFTIYLLILYSDKKYIRNLLLDISYIDREDLYQVVRISSNIVIIFINLIFFYSVFFDVFFFFNFIAIIINYIDVIF